MEYQAVNLNIILWKYFKGTECCDVFIAPYKPNTASDGNSLRVRVIEDKSNHLA